MIYQVVKYSYRLTDASESSLQGGAKTNNLNISSLVGNTALDLEWTSEPQSREQSHKRTRPVATVPRPEIEKTSSMGIRKGFSKSPIESYL